MTYLGLLLVSFQGQINLLLGIGVCITVVLIVLLTLSHPVFRLTEEVLALFCTVVLMISRQRKSLHMPSIYIIIPSKTMTTPEYL